MESGCWKSSAGSGLARGPRVRPRPLVLEKLLIVGFFGLLAGCFSARALFTSDVLLPIDALFLYPPWQRYADQFGIAIPNNHLIADTILQNYSWKALAASSYASGQAPLWNPYILAGQPFLAAGQNASLYPPGALYYLFPAGQAYEWFIALHLVLAGALTFWLARVLGATRFGGLVAGISFAFCGYLVVSVLWPMVVSTAVWLPGLLAVTELLVRQAAGVRQALGVGRLASGDPVGGEPPSPSLSQRERGLLAPRTPDARRLTPVPLVLLGAAMLSLQFLAGHLEMSLYLLATVALYAGLRLLGAISMPATRNLRGAIVSGGLLLGMATLGSLGAAAQLVPFAEAISANVRGRQVTYEQVLSYALPRQQLAAFVVPDWFGNPSHHAVFDLFALRERALDEPVGQAPQKLGTEWGPKNYVEGTAYLGILPLLLAGLALFTRRDGPTWTLAAVGGVSLLLAFGTPLYGLLFFGLPGVDQLHTPFRWVYPYSLCLAVLAGLGASSLEIHAPGRRVGAHSRAPAVVGAASTALAGALLLGLVAAALFARGWWAEQAERALRRSSQLAQAFGDGQAFFSHLWSSLFGLGLLVLASGLVVLALARGVPGARPLALALLIGDLFSFGIGFNTVSSSDALAFVPPSIQAIKRDSGLFRVATLGEADILPANTNMLFGLQDIRGYDTIILRDYVAFLELIEPQRGLLYSKVDKLHRAESLDSPLLDLLNVRYVLTNQRVESPGWSLVHDGDVRVYQNGRALPRAFIVEQALIAADQNEAFRLVGRPDFNPRRQVVVEAPTGNASTDPAQTASVQGAPAVEARVLSYEPNRVSVLAQASGSAHLVLGDMSFPGWRVHVDGAEQPLLRANGIFRAVQLQPGTHEVSFEYRPFSFGIGLLLSGLAVGLGVLALVAWMFGRAAFRAQPEGLSPVGRVINNSVFPLATGLVNRGLDFVFALVYLRVLGPQGTGAYTFAVVIVGYFEILMNFGLGTLLTREVARERGEADRYFASTLAARLGLAVLALLLALALSGPLAGPLEIGPEVGLAIVLFTLGLIPGALASTSGALFMARERMDVPAVVTVLSTLVKIGLGTGALLAGWGIVGLAVVSLAVNLLNSMVLGGLAAALLGGLRLQVDPGFIRHLLSLAWPLMLNNLLNSLFFRIDAVLLKPLAGEAALGYYSTAYKIIDGLQIIPSTFVLALFPMLSRQAGRSRDEMAMSYAHGLRVLLSLAFPISIGTTLLAEPIIGFFAGPTFLPEAALALQVLIWFLPLSFVNGLTQYVLIALNRQRWITVSFVIGALANLALNLWAIPRYGFVGAAAVTVVSEWVLLAPFWYVVRKELPPLSLLRLAWRPLLAASVMGLAVFWARDFNPWLAIPLGAIVYVCALFGLKGFNREELGLLLQRGPVHPA